MKDKSAPTGAGGMDVATLAERAKQFSLTLAAAKKSAKEPALGWYPYDSLANLWTLDRLLTGERRWLGELAAGAPLLDIGCADGDLPFFFESVGFHCQAVDNPLTNYNAMEAVRALKDELQSNVEIISTDLDSQFTLPERQYGLVLLLGVLYHLKNPCYVLDTLARRSRYCIISTAITDYVPGIYDRVTALPLAYLADVYELNQDSTNYWIFSDAGFRRLLHRCNWEICDYLLTAAGDANQTGRIAGGRAFCLARSTFADGAIRILPGKGWHAPEPDGWQWTERVFSLRIEGAPDDGRLEIRFEFFLPDTLFARSRAAITLSGSANGVPLPAERFTRPGRYEYRRELPMQDGRSRGIRLDFWLDSFLPAAETDGRELGIVVAIYEADLV